MRYPVVEVRQPGRTSLYLSVREPVTLGRDCDGLIVLDAQVSRVHLRLDYDAGNVLATDLDSTNGTFLDGERVTVPVFLTPGSVISLGDTELRLAEAGERLVPGDRRSTLGGGEREPASSTIVVSPDTGVSASTRQTSIDSLAAVVAAEKPDLSAVQDDAGTVTIVFSDIESSTERALAMGDIEWMRVLDEHNRIVREQLVAFGGTEIKNQGDGFMLSFPGARRAVKAMMEMQKSFTEQERTDPDRAVRVRMGCHTGEVIVDDTGDLFGRHVILAARIGAQADGGQILVSGLVRELISARGDVSLSNPITVELKGIDEPQVLWTVDWE